MKQSHKTNWALPWTFCTVTASLGRMCFFMAFQQQSMLTTTHEPLPNIFVWKFSLPYLLCIYLTSMLVNFWSLTTSSAVIFKPLRPTNVVLQTFTFALMVHPMHILFDFFLQLHSLQKMQKVKILVEMWQMVRILQGLIQHANTKGVECLVTIK